MNSSWPFTTISPELLWRVSHFDPSVVALQVRFDCPALPISSDRVALAPSCTVKGSTLVLTASFADDASSVNCKSALREPRSSLAWIMCGPAAQNAGATISTSNEPVTLTGMELFALARLAASFKVFKTSAACIEPYATLCAEALGSRAMGTG